MASLAVYYRIGDLNRILRLGIDQNIMTYATSPVNLLRFKRLSALLSAIMALWLYSDLAQANRIDTSMNAALSALLNSKQHPLLQQRDFSRDSNALTRLYRAKGMQPIWLGKNRSEKNINDVLALLNNADKDGLNPINYDAQALHHYIRLALEQTELSAQTLASYDLALSISVFRFCHDLEIGRIDPRNFNYPAPFGTKSASNIEDIVKTHIDQENIDTLPDVLAPKLKQYQLLKQALDYYRHQTETIPRYFNFSIALHPGEHDPQLPEMRLRLLEMGQLTQEEMAGSADAETLYDDIAKTAVMRLQQQQGLNADGFIGKQTQALLNQTAKDKITLIELAMERLRWLPKLPEGRQIFVNIAAYQLWAFDSPDDENPLSMKVVVGKSKENQTPILWESMRYLEFMPYWNIPRSILDKEIMPKIQSDGGYLNKQSIQLVDSGADEGDDPNDSNAMHQLKHGFLRARQMPGNKNPLGKVKFIFPNKDDVYLHDTPSRGAFSRDKRDLSHGCVRVSEAEKLAEFVLKNQQGWDKQTIQQAMTGDKTQRVSLKTSIPVMFYYTTAYAGQDNKLRFYPDIYGYDEQLQSAINKSANQQLITNPVRNDG